MSSTGLVESGLLASLALEESKCIQEENLFSARQCAMHTPQQSLLSWRPGVSRVCTSRVQTSESYSSRLAYSASKARLSTRPAKQQRHLHCFFVFLPANLQFIECTVYSQKITVLSLYQRISASKAVNKVCKTADMYTLYSMSPPG